jgi:hypothetical protein
MADNGHFELRYDERNRLDRVIVGGLTTTYGVNGLGERTTKDGRPAFGVLEHVYDLSGHLLGLYESGALDEEIVWLGALPVGTIQGGAADRPAASREPAAPETMASRGGEQGEAARPQSRLDAARWRPPSTLSQ